MHVKCKDMILKLLLKLLSSCLRIPWPGRLSGLAFFPELCYK